MKPTLIAAVVFILSLTMCTTNTKKENTSGVTNNDSLVAGNNKMIVLRVYTDMVNKRNVALVDSFYHSNIIDHAAFAGQKQGIDGFRKAVSDLFALFSEMEVTVDDVIAGDNIVASHETWRVTKAKDNKIATGKTMHIFKIADGKITDEWSKGWEWLYN